MAMVRHSGRTVEEIVDEELERQGIDGSTASPALLARTVRLLSAAPVKKEQSA